MVAKQASWRRNLFFPSGGAGLVSATSAFFAWIWACRNEKRICLSCTRQRSDADIINERQFWSSWPHDLLVAWPAGHRVIATQARKRGKKSPAYVGRAMAYRARAPLMVFPEQLVEMHIRQWQEGGLEPLWQVEGGPGSSWSPLTLLLGQGSAWYCRACPVVVEKESRGVRALIWFHILSIVQLISLRKIEDLRMKNLKVVYLVPPHLRLTNIIAAN